VEPALAAPRLFVVNARGQTTAVLDGPAITVEAIVAAARATAAPRCTDPRCGPNCRHNQPGPR
jgi:hypothetical protein